MKKWQIINFIFFVIILFLTNCSPDASNNMENFFDFTEPTISSVSPDDNKTGVTPFQEIKVEFSEDVDRDYAEQAFSLASSGNTDGRFDWNDDKTLIYTPIYGWTIGEKYTVTIERSLKDKNRNTLQRKFVSKFYIGNDFAHPYITNITSNPYVQENDIVLTINFSKPMDITSLQSAISISPGFTYRMELNDGTGGNPANTILTITVLEKLSTMKEYTLTISTKAKSLSGLPLLRDYLYNFAMYIDIEKPEIMQVQLGSVDVNNSTIDTSSPLLRVLTPESLAFPDPNDIAAKNESIIITFNEPMDRSTAESAFSIDPEITGRFYWKSDPIYDPSSDILIFTPDSGYLQSTTYKFFIESTAKDLVGNQLDTRSDYYNIRLATMPIKVVQVIFNPELGGETVRVPNVNPPTDPDYFLTHNTIIEGIHIETLTPTDYTGDLTIRIHFNNTAGTLDTLPIEEIDPISLYSKIKLTHELGPAGDPIIIDFNINNTENYIDIGATDLDFNNTETYKNIYKLVITGNTNGIKDIYGNYMENTTILYFKVDGRY